MQLLNPKNDKNKIRSFCLSISRRNTDIPEVIDEYSEILNLTKADTICHIIREYPTLKNKERFREMQAMGLSWNILFGVWEHNNQHPIAVHLKLNQ